MKKSINVFILVLFTTFFSTFAPVAQADFFGSNNNGEWKMGPNGPYWDESNWPEWTPMYWMEEFMDNWDNDDNNYSGGGYGMPGGNGFQGMPQGGGYGYPAMPMPYGSGGGYGYPVPAVPYGGSYPIPQAPPIVVPNP